MTLNRRSLLQGVLALAAMGPLARVKIEEEAPLRHGLSPWAAIEPEYNYRMWMESRSRMGIVAPPGYEAPTLDLPPSSC